MSQFDPPPSTAGAGQTQQVPLESMRMEQAQFPPPPSYPLPPNVTAASPEDGTTEQPPPLPVRSPERLAEPNQEAAYIACPRCTFNNHFSMTVCEACEAPLPTTATHQPNVSSFAPPPQHHAFAPDFSTDDPANPIHYTRDPHKIVAYIVPLPEPQFSTPPANPPPRRFLIYTPPPPPLTKPSENSTEKEATLHKVQRRWQQEVRSAKTSDAKVTSWAGIRSRMTKAADKGMSYTTSSNLDFLSRITPSSSPGHSRPSTPERLHASDGVQEGLETKKTVGIEELVLVYPSSMGSEDTLREEFVNTLMRTKSKAQRDAVIATGAVPVGYAVDILLVVVSGLGEIATVWLYKSVVGAKTARNITKRLHSSGSGDPNNDTLKLTFKPSPRVEALKQYLDAECNKVDAKLFPGWHHPPTESNILEAIGWSPSQTGGETKNWEDEQWEIAEVKDDIKITMHKGAKEWKKWCYSYEKDPEKALSR